MEDIEEHRDQAMDVRERSLFKALQRSPQRASGFFARPSIVSQGAWIEEREQALGGEKA
jgi:hypothetical protein